MRYTHAATLAALLLTTIISPSMLWGDDDSLMVSGSNQESCVSEENPSYRNYHHSGNCTSNGSVALQRGDYIRAEQDFQNALKANPANIDAKLKLCFTWAQMGKAAQAIKLVDELKPVAPTWAAVFLCEGMARAGSGDARGASVAFRQAMALEPEESRHYLAYARYLAPFDPAEAADFLAAAYQKHPAWHEVAGQAGLLYHFAGKDARAAELLTASCANMDATEGLVMPLIVSLHRLPDHAALIADMRKGMVAGKPSWRDVVVGGVAYLDGDIAAARTIFTAVGDNLPATLEVKYFQGRLAMDDGDERAGSTALLSVMKGDVMRNVVLLYYTAQALELSSNLATRQSVYQTFLNVAATLGVMRPEQQEAKQRIEAAGATVRTANP